MRKLFIANFPWDTHEPELREHFEQVGEIVDVAIRRDKNGMPSFCFVTYAREEDARTALVKFQGSVLNGRHLKIEIASRQ